MILEPEDYEIDSADITRLNLATIVFTGEDEETTWVSLECFDELSKDKVKLKSFDMQVEICLKRRLKH